MESLRFLKLLTSSLGILAWLWFLPVLWMSVPRPEVAEKEMFQEAISCLGILCW